MGPPARALKTGALPLPAIRLRAGPALIRVEPLAARGTEPGARPQRGPGAVETERQLPVALRRRGGPGSANTVSHSGNRRRRDEVAVSAELPALGVGEP